MNLHHSMSLYVKVLGVCICLTSVKQVSAASFDTIEDLSQAQFLEFSKNLSASTHYKSLAPPETLGTLGFDVGLEVSSTDIRGQLFDQASDGSFSGSELVLPRVHAHKGLPFGLDVAASMGVIADTDASVLGGEIRYAIVDGGAITPAVGIRASYSQVEGFDSFGLKSYAVELGVSKGFLFLTPYAGIGIVKSTISPENSDSLSAETYEQKKLVLGATINIGLALTLEVDRTDELRTYSAKVGIRF